MSVERPDGGIVYSLRLHNDSQTVIGRIKNALKKATFPFYGCVFDGKPWPDGVNILHREIIEQSLRLIWKGDGNYTDGYVNETDEFLDAIGLPKRERGSLIRMIHDCDGRVCKYCGVSGFNRRYPGDYGRAFYIFPNGDEVCCDCESRIECGLDPLAWRGESKEGVAK